MGVDQERLWGDFFKLELDAQHILAFGEPGAIGDAEDMRVDRDARLAERRVKHDIGGLAPDSGEFFELLAGARDLAGVVADQRLGQRDDVPGLGVEQADGLDRRAHFVLAQRDHLLGPRSKPEQTGSGEIDRRVGGLGGDDDGDQQSVRVGVVELSGRRRIGLGEAAEEFENLVALHSDSMTSRIE